MLWSLNIALDAYVLAQGRWRPLTRWLQIGLSTLSLAILGWMLVSGPLLAWPALELTARWRTPAHWQQLTRLPGKTQQPSYGAIAKPHNNSPHTMAAERKP